MAKKKGKNYDEVGLDTIRNQFYKKRISNREMSTIIRRKAKKLGWHSDTVLRLKEIYEER